MKKLNRAFIFLLPLLIVITIYVFIKGNAEEDKKMSDIIRLPKISSEGRLSVEEAINRRESIRDFTEDSLEIKDVSQLLWAAGGERVDALSRHSRTFPSPGGLNPFEFYLAAGNVDDLPAGIYKYLPDRHSLLPLRDGDKRDSLARAALGQRSIERAPASIIISGEYGKTAPRYGQRGKERYVPMGAGHCGQNIYLTAASRGLATVAIGAFNDDSVSDILNLSEEETPLYIYPLGRLRS
ncbi:MAG: SagB/ThcOx family dehydrogenase [Elusimicrobiota bacterium]